MIWRILLVVVLALSAPSAARADDSLGATLAVPPGDEEVHVTSWATLPVAVTLTGSDGWTVDPTRFTLAPGEVGIAAVVERGEGPGTVRAVMVPADPSIGEGAALALVIHLGHVPDAPAPPPWLAILLTVSLLFSLAVLGVGILRWRRHAD